MTVRRIDVTGVSITYERVGSGPPLLLLHGALSDHREWRAQIDGLADAFDVVAWDAPGCGGSSDAPQSFRFPEYANVLAAFIDALELGAPHVLGLSWGSSLALALYGARPELVRSLVLTAAYAGWAGSLPSDEVRRRVERVQRDLAGPPEGLVRTFLPTLFSESASPELVAQTAAILRDYRPDGVRPMLYALAEADLRGVLPTIDVPTLLLYGVHDARSSGEVAAAMHASIPASTLVFLPDAGHQSNIETPGAFNDAVRGFLM